MTSLMICTA